MYQEQQGFTLLELILVMVIMGVLAATAMPKFTATADFQARAFYDDTLSAIRYAQKSAIATGCTVQVSLTTHGYHLKRPADHSQCRSVAAVFSMDVLRPASDKPFANTEPTITLSPNTTFTFNALGSASAAVTLNLTGNRHITVVQSTGFVYGS